MHQRSVQQWLCVFSAVPDNDGDGVCNATDNCPNTPGQIGSTCNRQRPMHDRRCVEHELPVRWHCAGY
ncbi:MAG: hypothetical protein IPH53_21325 [Flavobacteriales bacterium]|nr:hypothetical protein [Flavobacteriales bacterium]